MYKFSVFGYFVSFCETLVCFHHLVSSIGDCSRLYTFANANLKASLAVFLMVVLFFQERLNVYREKFQRCLDRSKGKD